MFSSFVGSWGYISVKVRLYHQIFCEELSNTEYNKIFSDDTYTHSICKYNDILYRISAEIAYKMYQTGNKQLHILQEDIEKIITDLHLKTDHIEQLVKRCYALCNYWKNDGKRGMAEFYHNNIRDFFLCEKIFFELEKIYRFFEPDCMADEQKRDKTIENFIARFGSLFSFSDFSDKVSEFIYYRPDFYSFAVKINTINTQKTRNLNISGFFCYFLFALCSIYAIIRCIYTWRLT